MNKENWNQNQRIKNNYSLTVHCCVISLCGESKKIHHYFQNLEKLGDTHRRIYNEKKTTQKDTTREHVARQSVSKLTLKIPPILLNTIKLVISLTWLEEIEHISIGHQHILFTNQKCAPYPERRTTWVERGIFVVTGMILWVEVHAQDIYKILQQQMKLSLTVTTTKYRLKAIGKILVRLRTTNNAKRSLLLKKEPYWTEKIGQEKARYIYCFVLRICLTWHIYLHLYKESWGVLRQKKTISERKNFEHSLCKQRSVP